MSASKLRARSAFDRKYLRPLLGIDEVGNGAIAGPLCVAGVVLPDDELVWLTLENMGCRDSKKMTENGRAAVFEYIKEANIPHYAQFSSAKDIDRIGAGRALTSMQNLIARDAINDIDVRTLLLDGNPSRYLNYKHKAVKGGDNLSLSIAAASIVAKVLRDTLMRELAAGHLYDWPSNKGYPSKRHKRALMLYGPSPFHRRSTRPVIAALARLPQASSQTEFE